MLAPLRIKSYLKARIQMNGMTALMILHLDHPKSPFPNRMGTDTQVVHLKKYRRKRPLYTERSSSYAEYYSTNWHTTKAA